MENIGMPHNEKRPGMSRGAFLKNLGIFGAGMLLMGEKAFGQQSEDLDSSLESKESVNAFLKDATSAYERAMKRYEEQANRLETYAKEHPGTIPEDMVKTERSRFETKNVQFKQLLQNLKTDLDMLTNGAWPRAAKSLGAIAEEQVIRDVNKANHVDTMDTFAYNIFTTLIPDEIFPIISEPVGLIPLTSGWFESTPWLKQHYEDVWNGNGMLSNAASGEVIMRDEDRANVLFDSLRTLQENISQLPEGPERTWIASHDFESFKDKKAFIFLHEKSFAYDLSTKTADSINVQQSFGPVTIHPLQTILLHEINMGLGILPDDTHMKPEYEGQPDPYLSAVNAAYVLKRIKEHEAHFPDMATASR